jgi:ABC-type nitrate/sulfonate/bicarbonate transport system substrate-binding protein
MKQLAGKTFAITGPGGGSDTYVRMAFLGAGMSQTAGIIVAAGSTANQLAALRANQVDCAVLASPAPQQAGTSMTQLFSVDIRDEGPPQFYTNYLYVGLVASDDYAAKNPDVVKRVSRALLQASKIAADLANAQAITTHIKQYFPGIDESVLLQAVKDAARGSDGYVTTKQIETGLTIYNTLNPSKAQRTDTTTLKSFLSAPVRDLISNPPTK